MIVSKEAIMSQRKRARRWTAEQAGALLRKIEQRGISVKQFAAERGIGVERLYRWKKRLAQRSASRSIEPSFSEVTIRPNVPTAAIEIELSGGVHLRVTGDSRVDDVVAILSRVPVR
jgi:transposase-like protein